MGEATLALQTKAISLHDRLAAHTLPFLASLLGCHSPEVWEQPLAFQVFDDVEGRRDPTVLQGAVAHTKQRRAE